MSLRNLLLSVLLVSAGQASFADNYVVCAQDYNLEMVQKKLNLKIQTAGARGYTEASDPSVAAHQGCGSFTVCVTVKKPKGEK
ncbi:MAG: hypothetical protein K2X47_15830 [Bdellovibrionales bacterium]|nr:hypothetical protein [Bdellovibrionales bacterium]